MTWSAKTYITTLLAALLFSACNEEATPIPASMPGAQVKSTPMRPPPTPRPTEVPIDKSNTTLVPGVRAGIIRSSTQYDQLVKLYGEKALRNKTINLGEGTYEAASILNLGKGKRLTIVWWDDTRRSVKEVREPGPEWTTPEGIHTGMTLVELEKAIGTFKMHGFGWDFGGTINLEGSQVSEYQNNLFIRLGTTVPDRSRRASVSGDIEYSSSDNNLRALKPVIREMVITLNSGN